MRRMLTLSLIIMALLVVGRVEAQCVPGGTCGPTNKLAWSNVTTNANGSALTNFAAFDARIGTTPGQACSSSLVRDLGNFGLGATPTAGTTQIPLNAAALGLPSGPVAVAIQTRNTAGVRSACSAEVAFTYDAGTVTPPGPDTTPPSVPANFGGTVVGTSQINLSWAASTDNVAVTAYELERCTGAGCTSFVKLATPTGTSFNNTGLSAGTMYRYRVRAMDAVPNPSAYSVIIAAATQSAPPPVTKITVTCSGTTCRIEWPVTAGAISYRVARVTSSGWTVTATTSATNVNISWLTGVNEYGVFPIMSSGEALLFGRVWTSK